MKRLKLVFDERRRAIRLAKRLRHEKPNLSLTAIADVLNQRGHRNSIGTPFDAQSVRTMLGEPVRKRPRLTLEDDAAIYQAYMNGTTSTELAQLLGISRQVINGAVRRHMIRSGHAVRRYRVRSDAKAKGEL